MSNKQPENILIIGAGFGGVKAALDLSRDRSINVTIISADDTFDYYPALYHTAAGGSRMVSSIPLGELFADKDVQVVIGRANKLDRKTKKVTLEDGRKFSYDKLIVAIGMVTNFFGVHGLKEHAKEVKSIERVESLKQYIQAQLTSKHRPDLNYVLIGGGPTGIEFAGALPHYLHALMTKYELPRRAINIELIEAKPHLLPQLPKRTSRAVHRRLQELGVKVMTNKTVTNETASELTVGDKIIPSKTVIWTAGVSNNPFFKHNKFRLNPRGRVVVDEFLSTEKDIYVIGDNADTLYSGMAQTALHNGQVVARNIIRQHHGLTPFPYRPRRPIYVIPVGEGWAAVVWGRFQFTGRIGWLLRLGADWIGYHDLEPWWKATARTLADVVKED